GGARALPAWLVQPSCDAGDMRSCSLVEPGRGLSSMSAPLSEGVTTRVIDTPRLRTHALTAGPAGGAPVAVIHGNVSSARFFEETMLALPQAYWGIAPDLRGFGASEARSVDARRGLRDFADDLHALFAELGLVGARKPHLLGWSMGGGVVMQ